MIRFKSFGNVCCISCCLFFGAEVLAQETPTSVDSWVQQLVDCVEHMPTAFGVGPKITHLDPDIGLTIVQTAWPKLANDMVKTGVLKTFAFSNDLPEKHPRLLQVLHLGMTDESKSVREYAAVYLAPYASQNFNSDADGYKQWYAPFGHKPLQKPQPTSQPTVQEKLQLNGDPKKTYFLYPSTDTTPPKDGYKLLVILPGGAGSEDMHPFVQRISKHAVPHYVVVQLVAPKWIENQPIIWPHAKSTVPGMKFTTDEFIEEIITEVKKEYKIDPRHIFTLSWSSGGPAAYAASLQENTSITGSYVSMSVFNSAYLPDLSNAKGHNYYIEHSPDDRMCPFRMAQEAARALSQNGATVTFETYQGGHGWRGDVFGRIRTGIEWLEANTNSDVEVAAVQE